MSTAVDVVVVLLSLVSTCHVTGRSVRKKTTSPPPSWPKFCSRDRNVVTCSNPEVLRKSLGHPAGAVLTGGVDLIVLSSRTCSCDVINVTKTLSDLDVMVGSTVRCGASDVRRCGSALHLPAPLCVSGTLVASMEHNVKWVLKHSVLQAWMRVEGVHNATVRGELYAGVLHELRSAVAQLTSPDLPEISRDLPASPRHPELSDTLVEYAHKATPTTTPLPSCDPFLAILGQCDYGREKESRRRKIDGGGAYHSNQEISPHRSTRELMNVFFLKIMMLHGNSRYRRVTKNKKKKETKFLFIVPHQAYVGGDFRSLGDDVTLEIAMKQEEQMKGLQKTLLHAPAAAESAPAFLSGPGALALPPGMAAVIQAREHDEREEEGEEIEEEDSEKYEGKEVDMDAVFDDDALLEGDLDAEADTDNSVYGPNRSSFLGAFGSIQRQGPVGVALDLVGPISRQNAADHRIKSFIIFFVSIVGVVVVMSSLLVLATKEKRWGGRQAQLYPKFSRSKLWRRTWVEDQHRADRRRNVIHSYPGEDKQFLEPLLPLAGDPRARMYQGQGRSQGQGYGMDGLAQLEPLRAKVEEDRADRGLKGIIKRAMQWMKNAVKKLNPRSEYRQNQEWTEWTEGKDGKLEPLRGKIKKDGADEGRDFSDVVACAVGRVKNMAKRLNPRSEWRSGITPPSPLTKEPTDEVPPTLKLERPSQAFRPSETPRPSRTPRPSQSQRSSKPSHRSSRPGQSRRPSKSQRRSADPSKPRRPHRSRGGLNESGLAQSAGEHDAGGVAEHDLDPVPTLGGRHVVVDLGHTSSGKMSTKNQRRQSDSEE